MGAGRVLRGGYSLEESPPMPYVDVVVHTPTRSRSRRVRAKIDTGFSDGLLLSIDDYLELGLYLYESSTRPCATIAGGYRVELRAAHGLVELNGLLMPCMIYTTVFARKSLIGRSILNRFKLTLDGRRGVVELRE